MNRNEYGSAYMNGCRRTVRFLLSAGLSLDDAMETAQAAWVRGWERRSQIRDSRKTLTWVNSIALNLYRSRLRKECRLSSESRDIPVPPRASLISLDLSRIMAHCRSCDRELLEKRYFYGYEIQDLAREQGCSRTAVRVRLMRARRSLKRLMEGYRLFSCCEPPGERRSWRLSAYAENP